MTYSKFQTQLLDSIHSDYEQLNNNVTILQKQVQTLQNNMSLLTKELSQAKTREQDLNLRVGHINEKLEAMQVSERYDDSKVGLSVYENMENFYQKNTHRWVLPCEWKGCRKASLLQVLQHQIVQVYSVVKKKLSIIQLGE